MKSDALPPADVLALQALAVVIGEEKLRVRFLDLTGFDAATLRARAGEPDVMGAVLSFLKGHEPDLLHVAQVLEVAPEVLAAANPERGARKT